MGSGTMATAVVVAMVTMSSARQQFDSVSGRNFQVHEFASPFPNTASAETFNSINRPNVQKKQ